MKQTRLSPFRLFISVLAIVGLASCGGFSSPSRKGSTVAHKTQPGGNYSAPTSSADGYAPSHTGQSLSSTRHSSADSAHSEGAPAPESIATDRTERPGLGTRFGEQRQSAVTTRRFERAKNHPFAKIALHYNSRAGIEAQAWTRGVNLRELRAQSANGGISISLVDQNGRLLDGGNGGGRTYVVGQDGQRYTLHIRNDTGGAYEVVSSVDGLDVIDGKPANMSKRGYIVAPYSTLVIDGFRTSTSSVAAFRFGSVSNSYAAQTSGDRNVGVIGFAFFAERGSRWTTDEIRRRETANPFPGGFAAPPAVVR